MRYNITAGFKNNNWKECWVVEIGTGNLECTPYEKKATDFYDFQEEDTEKFLKKWDCTFGKTGKKRLIKDTMDDKEGKS